MKYEKPFIVRLGTLREIKLDDVTDLGVDVPAPQYRPAIVRPQDIAAAQPDSSFP
jgi:hypothetical protein